MGVWVGGWVGVWGNTSTPYAAAVRLFRRPIVSDAWGRNARHRKKVDSDFLNVFEHRFVIQFRSVRLFFHYSSVIRGVADWAWF